MESRGSDRDATCTKGGEEKTQVEGGLGLAWKTQPGFARAAPVGENETRFRDKTKMWTRKKKLAKRQKDISKLSDKPRNEDH